MKTLFTISAGLTLLLGIAWLFAPGAMLASWGVQGDGVTIYMSRRYGGLFIGYATLLWMARGAASSPARTAILTGGAAVTAVMTVVSLVGILAGIVGPMVWIATVVEVLLAGSFTYYLVTGRE